MTSPLQHIRLYKGTIHVGVINLYQYPLTPGDPARLDSRKEVWTTFLTVA